jgi:hypothetical protein
MPTVQRFLFHFPRGQHTTIRVAPLLTVRNDPRAHPFFDPTRVRMKCFITSRGMGQLSKGLSQKPRMPPAIIHPVDFPKR